MSSTEKPTAEENKNVSLAKRESCECGEVLHLPSQLEEAGNLKRSLSQRHLMMMAIGGVIGPGYFVGMGTGLSSAGPAGLLVCFSIVGTLLWAVMQSLGELAAYIAVSGSFTNYTARFIDPAVAFALGWNYWLLWAGIMMAEYNNIGLILTYWHTAIPNWGWMLVFWFIFMAFTFLGVYAFGEAEFWLSSLKLVFIVAFFICAILITSGVIGGQKIGFEYYRNPGAFANGIRGVFEIFVFAALQYSGTEMVGLTAGESANPARDVPKAIRTIFWRILFIFVGGIFFINLCVPFDDPNLLSASSKTARSPFVLAFTRVGVDIGAHLVNAVILVTIFSSINGGLYVGSRTLYGLAELGQAPKIFKWTNKRSVPVPALVFTNAVGFLSLLNLSSGAGAIYTWIVSITGVSTFIVWGCICLCHIRFRRAMAAQNVPLSVLPYQAAFWPYGAYYGLGLSVFFIFFQGWTAFAPWSATGFVMNYIMIPVFILLAAGWKIFHKTKWARSASADILTGVRVPADVYVDEGEAE